MTNADREAQIRENAASQRRCGLDDTDLIFMLRLLDEARAERDDFKSGFEAVERDSRENAQKYKAAKVEIARLQAPPGASAIERLDAAKKATREESGCEHHYNAPSGVFDKHLHLAIEQAEAEARADEKNIRRLNSHDFLEGERIKREVAVEARAAAIEIMLEIIRRYGANGDIGCPEFEAEINALAKPSG